MATSKSPKFPAVKKAGPKKPTPKKAKAAPAKPKAPPKRPEPKKVTRGFMLDLADSIFDPKTKRFMHLCDGKLQNGPGPKGSKKDGKPMHCGLGELYFAMVGVEPEVDGVNEDQVIDRCVALSTFEDAKDRVFDDAKAQVMALQVSNYVKDELLDRLAMLDPEDDDDLSDNEETFRSILNDIPGENDDECGDACSIDDFRWRAKRVADKLREAAELLPAV